MQSGEEKPALKLMVYLFIQTKWNGNQFYKYDIDGTFIDSLTIPSVSNIRDLAYDGTYFFGGAASTTVYEFDLANHYLNKHFFIAPTNVRAIAYNEDDDAFYANNWGSDITKFNISGNFLGSFPVGPVGDSYYGFAYDDGDGSCLYRICTGWSKHKMRLVFINLPSGDEAGIYFDVGSVVSVDEAFAGGLVYSRCLL